MSFKRLTAHPFLSVRPRRAPTPFSSRRNSMIRRIASWPVRVRAGGGVGGGPRSACGQGL